MQTIRITITSEKPTSVEITEQRTQAKTGTKKAALAALEAMFGPVLAEKKVKKCN